MLAGMVYLLCAVTSAACAALLLRGFFRSHVRLLLWSGLCFIGLALNSFLLFVDMKVLPAVDLSVIRTIPALLGMACLLYGMIWEEK